VMSNHRDYGFCAVISKPYRMGELKKTLAAIQDAGSSACLSKDGLCDRGERGTSEAVGTRG
jgi:hypothetical protein